MDTTLQVPLAKSLKAAATEKALKEGFSSLQEAVRVFLTKLANSNLTINFGEQFPDEILTPRQEAVLNRKFEQAMKDIKKGDCFVANNVDEMMRYLDS